MVRFWDATPCAVRGTEPLRLKAYKSIQKPLRAAFDRMPGSSRASG